MADILGMDPTRIARLRDPARLTKLDPARVWDVVAPPRDGTVVDLGAGVGYFALPFARAFPAATVVACDVLEGMVELLRREAEAEGLDNLRCLRSEPARVPLDDAAADVLTMVQVHHELDDAPALLAECARVLRPGGTIAIVDWKDEDSPAAPAGGRRVPVETIVAEVAAAGFRDPAAHDVYPHHSFVTGVR